MWCTLSPVTPTRSLIDAQLTGSLLIRFRFFVCYRVRMRMSRSRRSSRHLARALSCCMALGIAANGVLPMRSVAQSAVASRWQSLANPKNIGSCDVNLLTDGTLKDHGLRFTPDSNGSYVNGSWSFDGLLPSGYDPGSMARAVLPDGRLLLEGGEVNNGVLNFTNLGAVYDPVTNVWTPVAPPPGWSGIGGAPSVVLPDGTFMMGRADMSGSKEQALFDAKTLSWKVTGIGKADANFEEGWTLLPGGGVMTIDTNPAGNPTIAERYSPLTGAWTSEGSTTVWLSDSDEMGPQVVRADGSVIVFGALSTGVDHTAIRSPSGTWSQGPDLPIINGQTYTMNDAPAALLPSGNVLFAESPSPGHTATKPTHFFEFDGDKFLPVEDPPNAASLTNTWVQRLLLPTGQVFATACGGTGLPMIYTPTGSANPAWAPTVTSMPSVVTPGGKYTITGTQFNGLSQGAMYGDEGQQATNYPLVRITNSATGHVFYCRTHDHSTMGIATGATPVSTNFDVPASIEIGPSVLEVVSNGIPSRRVSVAVQPGGSNSMAPAILSGGVVPVGSSAKIIQSGEWASIYGTNLAPSTASWTGNFPTSLAGVSVEINSRNAYLSYVSPTQINFQVPSDATIGLVPVVVTTAAGTASETVTLSPFAPSFFLLDGKHVAGVILRSDGSGVYNQGTYDLLGPEGSALGYRTVAAKGGDLVSLYGTGWGPTNPPIPPGQTFSGAAATANPVQLSIGGSPVTALFTGLSGAGLYQINFAVPLGLGAGDLPVILSVGGSQTPIGTVIAAK
jgi:uncharacterized protein (TIGR03437 family)